jgi:hypothetical protein
MLEVSIFHLSTKYYTYTENYRLSNPNSNRGVYTRRCPGRVASSCFTRGMNPFYDLDIWFWNSSATVWYLLFFIWSLCLFSSFVTYHQKCQQEQQDGFMPRVKHGVNSTVEISWNIFIILADYCLRHLDNNMTIYIYATHDYIRMEITVLYFQISRHQLEIW